MLLSFLKEILIILLIDYRTFASESSVSYIVFSPFSLFPTQIIIIHLKQKKERDIYRQIFIKMRFEIL